MCKEDLLHQVQSILFQHEKLKLLHSQISELCNVYTNMVISQLKSKQAKRDFNSLDLDNPDFNNNLSNHMQGSELQINWKLFDLRGNLRNKIDWLESLKSWY